MKAQANTFNFIPTKQNQIQTPKPKPRRKAHKQELKELARAFNTRRIV